MTTTTKVRPEDIRNGWTQETLDRYLKERSEQSEAYTAMREARAARRLRVEALDDYDPHNW